MEPREQYLARHVLVSALRLEALDRAKSLGVDDATRFEREHVGLEDGP